MSTWRRALIVLVATLVSGVLVTTAASADPKDTVDPKTTVVPLPVPASTLVDICAEIGGAFSDDADVYRCTFGSAEVICEYANPDCRYLADDVAPLEEACQKAGSKLSNPAADVFTCGLTVLTVVVDCNPEDLDPPPSWCAAGYFPNETPIR